MEERQASDCDIGINHAVEGHKNLDKKFSCSECSFSTCYRSSLKQHLLTHSGERPHQCEVCDKAFAQSGDLRKHRLVHTEERPHVCDTCGRGFTQISALRRHEVRFNKECRPSKQEGSNTEPKKKFCCSECPYSTDYKIDLKRHQSTHSGERPHLCELCGKAFAQKCGLKRHLIVHSAVRPFTCDTCGRGFIEECVLRVHKRTHFKEKPDAHSCSFCGKSFAKFSNLTCHLRIHNGEPPYACDICGKGFNHKSSLRNHKAILKGECHLLSHRESHQKNFRCSQCPYATDYKTNLMRHLLTHTGERPYQCKLCDKSFNQSGALKTHSLVHSEEGPRVCDTCGKGFRDKSSLQDHKAVLKGECHLSRHSECHQKKFYCSECPYATDYRTNLMRHLLTHSGEQQGLCSIRGSEETPPCSLKICGGNIFPDSMPASSQGAPTRGAESLASHLLVHTG